MNFEVKNYNVREANDSYAIVRAYVVNVGKNIKQILKKRILKEQFLQY